MSNWYDRGIAGLNGVYQEAIEDSSEAIRAAKTGEITYAESALRQAGSAATLPSYVLDSVFSMLPGYEYLQEKIGEAIQYGAQTKPGQEVVSYLQENPRLAKNLEASLNVAEFIPGLKALSGARTANVAEKNIGQLAGPESGKGMLLAPLDNYIPGFYGRSEVTGTTALGSMEGASPPLNPLEKQIERRVFDPESALNTVSDLNFINKVKKQAGVDETKKFESTPATRSAVTRASSMASFVAKGAKNIVKDYFSPEARALFREQGLSRTGRDIIAAHLAGNKLKETAEGQKILEDLSDLKTKYKELPKDKGRLTPEHEKVNNEIQQLASSLPSRGIPKAVAEAIYQLHIGEQAGRKGGLNVGLAEIAKESFLEPYNKYDSGTLSSWFTKHNRAKSDDYDVSLSEEVATALEQNIINAQKSSFGKAGVPAIVVMKEPSKPLTSGNHQYDVTNTKVKKGASPPPAARIQKAFKALGNKPTTQQELKLELQRQGLKITGEGADGKLYFSGGAVGSAIVEGGINVSGFVKPDGTAAFIMSDVHDFFEKVKPLKAAADVIIPDSLLAVSPPVFKNFLDEPKKQPSITNKSKKDKGYKAVDVREALEKISSAQPSKKLVDLERKRQQGMLTGVGSAAVQPITTAAGNQEEEMGR